MNISFLKNNDSEQSHLGIISSVANNAIEIVQQNILDKPRQNHCLEKHGRNYFVTSPNVPAGWLKIR